MTRIATKEEVIALLAELFQPPMIATVQGGNAISASYGGGEEITIKRSAAVSRRRSTHSNR